MYMKRIVHITNIKCKYANREKGKEIDELYLFTRYAISLLYSQTLSRTTFIFSVKWGFDVLQQWTGPHT